MDTDEPMGAHPRPNHDDSASNQDVGVGIVFQPLDDGTLYVKRLKDGEPAARSGLIKVLLSSCLLGVLVGVRVENDTPCSRLATASAKSTGGTSSERLRSMPHPPPSTALSASPKPASALPPLAPAGARRRRARRGARGQGRAARAARPRASFFGLPAPSRRAVAAPDPPSAPARPVRRSMSHISVVEHARRKGQASAG